MRGSGGGIDGAVTVEAWPFTEPLVITGYVFPDAAVVTIALEHAGLIGRGEAAGVYYREETADGLAAQLERFLADAPELTRPAIAERLSPGGMRNALDCALWSLDAQRAGEPVWRLAGLAQPRPLRTTWTISVGDPGRMVRRALELPDVRALKLKLNGDGGDAERIRAIRQARPDVWLGVDANQAFDLATLASLETTLVDAGVRLVEQPLPVGQEEALRDLRFPVPLAADESVQSSADLEALVDCFDTINIKLDKCGGLTEGLVMARRAKALGLQIMVGNMTCTSLGLAPAFLLGQICDLADLDGPTFLRKDRAAAAVYANGDVHCDPAVWETVG